MTSDAQIVDPFVGLPMKWSEPVIPMLDIPGHDAGRNGLPNRSQLTTLQRLWSTRPPSPTLVCAPPSRPSSPAPSSPSVVSGALRRSTSSANARVGVLHRDRTAQNSELSFPAPMSFAPGARSSGRPFTEFIAKGNVDIISFQSSFQPLNPLMRDRWNNFSRNNIAWAQHWRHDDGPRPTLCLIHGFMGSAYMFNGLFFSLPWFYQIGYDVLLYTLPFHGRRAERNSPFSGYGYFANGLTGFAEAMAHAVHDFRSVVDWLCHNRSTASRSPGCRSADTHRLWPHRSMIASRP